jgi:hypothetical protein
VLLGLIIDIWGRGCGKRYKCENPMMQMQSREPCLAPRVWFNHERDDTREEEDLGFDHVIHSAASSCIIILLHSRM